MRDGEVHYTAFQPKKEDIKGVSLILGKKEAGKRFGKPLFGFLDVDAEAVEKIPNDEGFLKVVEDLDDPGHVSIIGIPYFYNIEKPARTIMKRRSQEIAFEVALSASKINEYVPEGFPPEDLLK